MAGSMQMLPSGMPIDWLTMLKFKEPEKDARLGYIDTLTRGVTFMLVTAMDEPIVLKTLRPPFECFTREDCISTGKGRGKLTVRIQLNERIWNSLHKLDEIFKSFLIRNRHKLFSAMDAEFIGRDNTAIALKISKPLAPVGPDGEPLVDAFITVRINGRADEIKTLLTKDGSSGKYVSGVEWAPRTSPLASSATRISLVTGFTSEQKPIVRDTLPIRGPVPVGAQRVRYVGPGDFKDGDYIRYATIRPLYWSMAPGGGAGITLGFDSLIIQPRDEESAAPVAIGDGVPEGFAAFAGGGEDDGSALALTSSPTSGPEKRRRIEPTPVTPSDAPAPSYASEPFMRLAPPAPIAPHRVQRSNTGGADGGTNGIGFFSRSVAPPGALVAASSTSAALRAMAEQQREYVERMEREHEEMRRTGGVGMASIAAAGGGPSKASFECSQNPAYDRDTVGSDEEA